MEILESPHHTKTIPLHPNLPAQDVIQLLELPQPKPPQPPMALLLPLEPPMEPLDSPAHVLVPLESLEHMDHLESLALSEHLELLQEAPLPLPLTLVEPQEPPRLAISDSPAHALAPQLEPPQEQLMALADSHQARPMEPLALLQALPTEPALPSLEALQPTELQDHPAATEAEQPTAQVDIPQHTELQEPPLEPLVLLLPAELLELDHHHFHHQD